MRTRGKGLFQMRTFALFGAKNFGCFGIYGVSARTGGVETVRTFCRQGEGSILRDFVRTSFMDDPLPVTDANLGKSVCDVGKISSRDGNRIAS